MAFEVSLGGWRTAAGDLWRENTNVILNAPGAMIVEDYTFLLRSVELTKSVTEESTILNLVPPESFSGGIPERLPWQVS